MSVVHRANYRVYWVGGRWSALLSLLVMAATGMVSGQALPPLVFVSRQTPPGGSIYLPEAKGMPGVGPHSRFRVAAPGKLLIRERDARLRVLVDGGSPSEASLGLIDVNAPDVSYDGREIVFAGLPSGNYDRGPNTNPGAWRLYRINVDGSGLRQVTYSDQSLDLSQFGDAAGGLRPYDDTDPVWLPDGRVVFSSTRWPSYAQYSGVRTTNLYVVNADGSGLHRITSERNGADRPVVDPTTGKIVFARWWRNHRFALDDLTTVPDSNGGYLQKDGLSARRDVQMSGRQFADFLWRNVWNPAAINPDGTDLVAWGGSYLQTGDGSAGHTYGGTITPHGELVANFFPMFNMTEAAGFGGLRRYPRGPEPFASVIGITTVMADKYVRREPPSYGIYAGGYAGEPEALPDGGLLISWAADIAQDYGLYRVNADGRNRTLIHDSAGTSELRVRAVQPRPRPPVLPDTVTHVANPMPPPASGPYDRDGTFVFDALNVYANAPVDTDIVNAPPVGSAATIRFFLDHQRTSPGSFPNLDWPILLAEIPVGADGAVRHETAPADVPLFEQLRSSAGTVPVTRGPNGDLGAAHVAGMNYGRPGSRVRCVGCHIGHTMIPVPADDADAAWTNLAPGAQVTVSSTRAANLELGLVDRQVRKSPLERHWVSAPGQVSDQWVRLTFPVAITVRSVRLYNPRLDEPGRSNVRVRSAEVLVCRDPRCESVAATVTTGPLKPEGTSVNFDEITGAAVLVKLKRVTGTFWGVPAASLAEVEVIARGGESAVRAAR